MLVTNTESFVQKAALQFADLSKVFTHMLKE